MCNCVRRDGASPPEHGRKDLSRPDAAHGTPAAHWRAPYQSLLPIIHSFIHSFLRPSIHSISGEAVLLYPGGVREAFKYKVGVGTGSQGNWRCSLFNLCVEKRFHALFVFRFL